MNTEYIRKKVTLLPREEVVFESTGNMLAGTLFTPEGPGPYPAMAFLVGSGGVSKRLGEAWGFYMWVTLAEHCMSNGVAVLLFDKPGLGGSTGNWEAQTFDDRADDALAAVRFLQTLKVVDRQKIGLIGHSQGGWIAQLAASKSKEVGFIISLAGPYISVYEQILMDRENHLLVAGASPMKKLVDMTATRALFLTARVAAKVGYKHPIMNILDYDPRPILPEVTCPVLALFGEKDVLCLPGPSLDVIKSLMPKGDVTTKVFPQTNHLFWRCKTGSTKEYEKLDKRFVPEFLESIISWMKSKDIVKGGRQGETTVV
ncbi:alpha/beta fold hydrolase [Bacillus tianshenii]|uniref:alpha/beta hydrolase family protein n=1 Tax=Sutcliffiella tianshenii TaxID=1463404 RepID=UPI001CD4DA37|nr:alpha/beta fold hydrolase [Bacillus tianshenii]MCA1318498.1 alpha/beta fold hydrolase [Bacillus tianshenii]